MKSKGGKMHISVDRSKLFDPDELFYAPGSTIIEQDERALSISRLKLSDINLVSMFEEGESITGGERLARVKKANYIRLDAKFFQVLLGNPDKIPREWEEYYIDFNGTIFMGLHKQHGVLCMYRNYSYGVGHVWAAQMVWLKDYLPHNRCVSAVIK